MKVEFFAKMLAADVNMILYDDNGSKKKTAKTVVKAGAVGGTKYADREIQDWRWKPMEATVRVLLK